MIALVSFSSVISMSETKAVCGGILTTSSWTPSVTASFRVLMVQLAQRLLLLVVCNRLLHNLLAYGRPGAAIQL